MVDPSNPADGRETGGAAGLAAEESASGDAVLRDELRRGDFLAVFVLGLEHLDAPSLGGHEEALRADFGDLADLALHRAEGAYQMLAAVENLDLFAVQRGPGAWSGIAAAYDVVDEIDVVRPADLRLGGAAPALVARLGLVLHGLAVLAGHHQVGGLEHRLHAHGEEAVEKPPPG